MRAWAFERKNVVSESITEAVRPSNFDHSFPLKCPFLIPFSSLPPSTKYSFEQEIARGGLSQLIRVSVLSPPPSLAACLFFPLLASWHVCVRA